jgi:pyrimidine-nucleoside phosphorylase
MDEIRVVVARVGCVITGATADLVPADRKLYALRDVTATVPSIPLITASIMSKKLAEGLDALVLDVKFGSGAFLKTAESARELAQSLVATGKRMGVATTALLTDMNQPLGRMAGNAVEVDEAIAGLEGRGPKDVMEVTLALGAEVLASAHNPPPFKRGISDARFLSEARAQLEQTIASGAAREKFDQMVAAQGGNLDAPRPVAPTSELSAPRDGYVASIDAEKLGQATIAMRGGRQKLGDALDHSTGFEMLARLGDRVDAGQPLVRLFATPDVAARVRPMILQAMQLSDEPCAVTTLVRERIA